MPLEIVAEIAQGFEGKPAQARLLLAAAAKSGADAAKFQIVYADELATRDYKYYELFTKLEMADSDWMDLAAFAEQSRVRLYCDVYGSRSLRLAGRMGVQTIKLHSTDIRNTALVNAIASSQIPRLMVGAGGADVEEVDAIVAQFRGKRIVLMHGFQGYPTPLEETHIARLSVLRSRYGTHENLELGYADHVPDDDVLKLSLSLVAVGAGATVIEKHLTLAGVLKLEDHEAAINPDQFTQFVRLMRQGCEALGPAPTGLSWSLGPSEQAYRLMTRKHVVAGRDLKAGERLEAEMLGLKRTSYAQPIHDVTQVVGRNLIREIKQDDPITAESLH